MPCSQASMVGGGGGVAKDEVPLLGGGGGADHQRVQDTGLGESLVGGRRTMTPSWVGR